MKTGLISLSLFVLLGGGSSCPAQPVPKTLPPLPKAVSSLGAVSSGGYLYVYGGHAGKTHSYDVESVLGTFHRLKLEGDPKWEELPSGPILQGMNLATHGGKVYRIGGMQPRNKPLEAADNHSVAECALFDPGTKEWAPLPSLPAARSSHDVVMAGDKLVVVGGWKLEGYGREPIWAESTLVLDLSEKKPEWKSIPQPFQRRALTAAAIGQKVYVVGGLTDSGPDKRVDILDIGTGKWTTGPKLPGAERVAFSPAAAVVNGRLVVNTSDGRIFRLNDAGANWEKVGQARDKRMVGRIVPLHNSSVLLVGGAGKGGNLGLIEVVPLAANGEPVSTD